MESRVTAFSRGGAARSAGGWICRISALASTAGGKRTGSDSGGMKRSGVRGIVKEGRYSTSSKPLGSAVLESAVSDGSAAATQRRIA